MNNKVYKVNNYKEKPHLNDDFYGYINYEKVFPLGETFLFRLINL